MLFHFRQDRAEMPKIGWTECNQMHSGEVRWTVAYMHLIPAPAYRMGALNTFVQRCQFMQKI